MDRFGPIVLRHLERYPALQIQDIYKLAHQAALGSGHMVRDFKSARRRLLQELAELAENRAEPVVDPISGDGGIVRVHLWPFRQGGGQAEALLQAFVRTANEHPGSPARLQKHILAIKQLSSEKRILFSVKDIEAFMGKMSEQGFPAIHHSHAYRAAYHPSYRVIARKFLPGEYPER